VGHHHRQASQTAQGEQGINPVGAIGRLIQAIAIKG
jgi:hypothetical protein